MLIRTRSRPGHSRKGKAIFSHRALPKPGRGNGFRRMQLPEFAPSLPKPGLHATPPTISYTFPFAVLLRSTSLSSTSSISPSLSSFHLTVCPTFHGLCNYPPPEPPASSDCHNLVSLLAVQVQRLACYAGCLAMDGRNLPRGVKVGFLPNFPLSYVINLLINNAK
jgi:hypothetical protein